jgi:hypothetical protein
MAKLALVGNMDGQEFVPFLLLLLFPRKKREKKDLKKEENLAEQ